MVEEWLRHFLFVTMRWLHIVCTTLVVGGTLFFEFVVPLAIEDLKNEQQLAVFGKARWVFKRVVVTCTALLLISGSVSLYRLWNLSYDPAYQQTLGIAMGHAATGIFALVIAIALTTSSRPPDSPIGWLRVNLAVLLIAILLANIGRHVRLGVRERNSQNTPGRSVLDSNRSALERVPVE